MSLRALKVWLWALWLSLPAAAMEKGDALQLTLKSGEVIQGTLLSETTSGFLLQTMSGTQLVNYADVTKVAGETPGRGAPSVGAFASRVSILARYEGDSYEVHLGERSCHTPCLLEVAPGPYDVRAEGTGFVSDTVLVPAGDNTLTVQSMSVAFPVGVALLIGGVGAGVIGTVMFIFAVGGIVGVAVGLLMACTGAVAAIIGGVMMLAATKPKAVLRRAVTQAPIAAVDAPLMRFSFGP